VHSSRAALAAILLLAVAIGACSSGSTSPTPTVEAPSPSLAESSASEGAVPSLPSSAKDLEALIPDTVGGVALQKLSMLGDEFANSGTSAEAEEFLRNLGVSPEDVAVAIGFGVAPDSGSGVAVFAFRAEGADSGRLLQTFKDATDAERETPLEWETANVGGKEVERATDPEQDNSVYLYVNGDVLVFVATTSEDDAAEVLSGLP
jgi:hypothetical protein